MKRKVYIIVDDTCNLFYINEGLSVFNTRQEALENCIYAEEVKEAVIEY